MNTILLIEENPNQRLLYRMELEDAGYRVMPASSGADAVGTAKQQRPDLVVLNPHLPDMQANVLIKFLRVHQAHLPVIVHSGDLDQQEKVSGSDFVLKSSDLAALKRAVGRLFHKRSVKANAS